MFSLNYPITLFPRQRTLCVVGRLGRKKAHGDSAGAAFSLSPSSPARLLFFDYCYFYWDTKREPPRRREQFTWDEGGKTTNSQWTLLLELFVAFSCSMERLGSLTLSSQLWRFKMLSRRKFNRVTITFTKTYFVCFFPQGTQTHNSPLKAKL